MTTILIDDLEYRINELKKELIQIAERTGLNSRETLVCSQKLDKLITIYQKSSYKKLDNMLLNGNKVACNISISAFFSSEATNFAFL